MGLGYCVHRWAVIKRWTDKDGFHAIQKCRRCSMWKRSDMGMETHNKRLEVVDAFGPSGLENESRKDENPKNVDVDDGSIGTK